MSARRELANAIRIIAIDAIEKAKSGHPGAPLGMADMAEALWRGPFRHNPANPHWVNRDRFVLSNGHASMLLYALLHLSGYDLSMEEIRNFRQLGSLTPGHPEVGQTPGVEISTGPLGQGISSAVGMALAERLLATEFNRPGHEIVDHYTYVFCGDGCLMEGVSHEACSLAGTWKLGKLIAFYDANGISIDGSIEGWFNEDVAARYKAYGWQVLGPIDGHDASALDKALADARANNTQPSLIVCHTHIGYASPKADSASCHGAPLGEEGIASTRKALGWAYPPFVVPENIANAWNAREAGKKAEDAWNNTFAAYAKAYPDLATQFKARMAGNLPANWKSIASGMVQQAVAAEESLATRQASKKALENLVGTVSGIIGGSADLTGSVGTLTSQSQPLDASAYTGNYLNYGVREFAMGTIMNGLAVHGGFIPYAGTFMSFSDQAKNALRLAALMKLRTVWVLTHDSIGVGEDGPTHQPVEQVSTLRLLPDCNVWRPCDTVETAVAWQSALETSAPTCLSLSRQKLPFVKRDTDQVANIPRGGYILRDCVGTPDIILLATGSEVTLVLDAATTLSAEGRKVRVVSMPCCEIFDAQDSAWRERVLPANVRCRLAVEAGSSALWWKYVGLDGAVLGLDRFGISAPGDVVARELGFTAERVCAMARALLDK